MTEAQGGVRGDGALAIYDLRDAVHRHSKLTGQLGGAYAEFAQFIGQMLAGMNSGACQTVLLRVQSW